MPKSPALPPLHFIRGRRVVFDVDLAKLYGVATRIFNQAIQRNRRRFPDDFLFQLTEAEFLKTSAETSIPPTDASSLRSQIVILKPGSRGAHRKYRPWAFTEHGAIMAATILRSPLAVAMSVYVVRAFVEMREARLTNAVILKRLEQVDRRLLEHDVVLRDIISKLRPLLVPPPPRPRRELGFHTLLKKPGRSRS